MSKKDCKQCGHYFNMVDECVECRCTIGTTVPVRDTTYANMCHHYTKQGEYIEQNTFIEFIDNIVQRRVLK